MLYKRNAIEEQLTKEITMKSFVYSWLSDDMLSVEELRYRLAELLGWALFLL